MPAYLNRLIYLSAILGAGYLVLGPERASETRPLVRRAEQTLNERKFSAVASEASKCFTSYVYFTCLTEAGCDPNNLECTCGVFETKVKACFLKEAAKIDTCSNEEDESKLSSLRLALRDVCVEKQYATDIPQTARPPSAATGSSVSSMMSAMSMVVGIFVL